MDVVFCIAFLETAAMPSFFLKIRQVVFTFIRYEESTDSYSR